MSDLPPDLVLEREQQALYGTYVANKAIDIGNARAFNVGDPVPTSHVERGIVAEDDVEKLSTKAGRKAAASSQTTTIEEP